jgi:hypothetical protein
MNLDYYELSFNANFAAPSPLRAQHHDQVVGELAMERHHLARPTLYIAQHHGPLVLLRLSEITVVVISDDGEWQVP